MAVAVEAASPDSLFLPLRVESVRGQVSLSSCSRFRLAVTLDRDSYVYVLYHNSRHPSELEQLWPLEPGASLLAESGIPVWLPDLPGGGTERFFYLDTELATEEVFVIATGKPLGVEALRKLSEGSARIRRLASTGTSASKSIAASSKGGDSKVPAKGAGASASASASPPDLSLLLPQVPMDNLTFALKGIAVGQTTYDPGNVATVEAKAGEAAVYVLEIDHHVGPSSCPEGWSFR